jgi:MYXO-CTERM domain-containing protein
VCASGGACESGHCVDDVCCESSCEEQCEACDVEESEGTCVAVPGAPHGGRDACASDGSPCGGTCDGTTRDECAFPDASTSCGEAICADGMASAPGQCDGTGTCSAGASESCSPYACGEDACLQSCEGDEDCASGFVCAGGACEEPLIPEPDAGAPDAGSGSADTGPDEGGTGTDAGPDEGGKGRRDRRGCDCQATGGEGTPTRGGALLLTLALLGLLARRRRRGERASVQ